MRRELLRKFHYPVDKILLNVMAADGSSIGESHSGFQEYTALSYHLVRMRTGTRLASRGRNFILRYLKTEKKPGPDLVIFGHGHNEHIDRPR